MKTKNQSTREDTAWHGVFENLPYYADKVVDENGKSVTKRVPITYRVREVKHTTIVDGEDIYTILDDYDEFPGNNNYNYTVIYDDTIHFPLPANLMLFQKIIN